MTDTTRFTGSRGLRASVSYRHLKRSLDFRQSVAGFGLLEN